MSSNAFVRIPIGENAELTQWALLLLYYSVCRPGKERKDSRCILGTVYTNQAFDSLGNPNPQIIQL